MEYNKKPIFLNCKIFHQEGRKQHEEKHNCKRNRKVAEKVYKKLILINIKCTKQ
jgi:hypothetical protein